MIHRTITNQRHQYCAWPAIARGKNSIVVSYCRSEEHLGPDGEIQIVRSLDGGENFGSPIVVRDTLIDDRECGMTPLSDGRILLHTWSTQHSIKSYEELKPGSYEPDVIEHWIAHVAGSEYRSAAADQGGYLYISADDGATWNPLGPGPDSIHGGIELSSGEVLIASYRESAPSINMSICSVDDLAFRVVARVLPPESQSRNYGEPHVAELPSGRIILFLRSTAQPYNDSHDGNVLYLSWSDDGAKSWAPMQPTELWGFPPHLLTLSDGRVLCTYGYRRPPFGERACISDDGVTWDRRREIVLRDDADSGDLGYPASLELAEGVVLTVYYQSTHAHPPARMDPPDPLRSKPDICVTRWNID